MYNYPNGEINKLHASGDIIMFFNDDFPHHAMFSGAFEAATPKNTLVFKADAFRLKDFYEYTSGELKKIASAIDPDDNPVLMITKFR